MTFIVDKIHKGGEGGGSTGQVAVKLVRVMQQLICIILNMCNHILESLWEAAALT